MIRWRVVTYMVIKIVIIIILYCFNDVDPSHYVEVEGFIAGLPLIFG
jgi:hypothetical protein